MINNQHASMPKVGGLISQLNSNSGGVQVMQQLTTVMGTRAIQQPGFIYANNQSSKQAGAYQQQKHRQSTSQGGGTKSRSRPNSTNRGGCGSGQMKGAAAPPSRETMVSALLLSKNSSIRSTNGSPSKQQFINQPPFNKINQICKLQPESVVNDVLSSDIDEESAIFRERPSQKHNESLPSTRHQKPGFFHHHQPSSSILSAGLSQSTVRQIERQIEPQDAKSTQQYFKHNVVDDDHEITLHQNDDDDDDSNTLSDRFLLDSARSNAGVNVPMNSLPKLSRHRKSDLLANELEGSPQKPSVAVHFQKRRIAAPTSRIATPSGAAAANQQQSRQGKKKGSALTPKHHQGKIEDSGVTQEKVILGGGSLLSSVLQPPETTNSVFEPSDERLTLMEQQPNGCDLKQSILSSMTVSQGVLKESNSGIRKTHLEINLVNQHQHQLQQQQQHQHLHNNGEQSIDSQKPLTGITPNKMTKSMLDKPTHTFSRREKPSVGGKGSQRQTTFNQFFGGTNKSGEEEDDALCLEDLATHGDHHEVIPTQSPRHDYLTSMADENVGETTPNKRREQKVNLSASENLSMSQYLSNSFQNSKRSSQLMQILKMSSSLASSQGAGGGGGISTTPLHKKMEVTQRHPAPHLLSGTRQKKEKLNYRIQPKISMISKEATQTNNHSQKNTTTTGKDKIFPSPQAKLQRFNQAKDSGELSGRKTVLQTNRDTNTPLQGQRKKSPPLQVAASVVQKRQPYPGIKQGGGGANGRRNEPHSLNVRHKIEPMKLMKPTPSTNQKGAVQRVKETGMMKRASFVDDIRKSGNAARGQHIGSFIRDEQLPNRVNGEQTKFVVAATKRTDEADIVSIEVTEDTGNRSLDQTTVRRSEMLSNARSVGSHIGAAALQRGMSPPAHVKNVSSDSRSSANIIENQSPIANRAQQKVLNNSHSHLTKYNRSAYKLKQYISDVNKINAKQQKKNNATKGKKVTGVLGGGGAIAAKNLKKTSDKQLNDSQVYTKKTKAMPTTGQQQQQQQNHLGNNNHNSQSQLTTQFTTKQSQQQQTTQQQQQQQLLKNQKSQKRINQRSNSPQESSLSRVLSYCPTSSYRVSNTRQNIFSQSSSHGQKGNIPFAAFQASSASNDFYQSQQRQHLVKHKSKLCLILPRFFRTLLSFLDFLSLFTMMQTRKDYRWDVCSRGKGYQPQTYWVHKEIRKRMKQILLRDGGLRSTVERRSLWIYSSKLTKIKQQYPDNHYEDLVEKYFRQSLLEQHKMSEIGKDVSRTFPDLQFFQKNQPGQKKLHRILTALSMFQGKRPEDGNYEEEPLGYTQGLNFITGTALVHLQQHEENTFWFLISILYEHKFRNVFNFMSEGTFRVLCFQLEVLTQVYLPDLHEHLARNKVPTDIYASNWFITLFVNDLPFDMAPSVLDVFLLEGHKGLLRIALSILAFLRSELLQLHQDELLVFLSHTSARESIFDGLDQYWLFQTSYTFKITSSLLDELHRLFILREKLSQLEQSHMKESKERDREMHQLMETGATKVKAPAVVWDPNLVLFFQMRYFSKLRICIDQSNVMRRHEWHVLMLGPDDVENLMTEEGLPTDEIEELRLFFNEHIKDKGLNSVLSAVEKVVLEHRQKVASPECVVTPRQGSLISTTNDIAQENYLKATNKMVVNSNSIVYKSNENSNVFEMLQQSQDKIIASKESSPQRLQTNERLSILPHPRISLNEPVTSQRGETMQIISLGGGRQAAQIKPDEGGEIRIKKLSARSSEHKMINLTSMQSTPRNNLLIQHRPIRQRNFADDSLQSLNLPLPLYGEQMSMMPQEQQLRQQPSLLEGWALDLGSRLGDLFRPLSMSPVNARMQPQKIQQSLYDSAKEGIGSTRRPPRHLGQNSGSSLRGGSTQNMSNRSRSAKNYQGEENVVLDKRSPDFELSKLKIINNSTGTTKERKTMTPHMMLSGDDQILVNASSSFDFSEAIAKNQAEESLKITGLTLPQKVQINESQFAYHATHHHQQQESSSKARKSYHSSNQRSSSQSSSKPQKPPRSTSTRVWHAGQQQPDDVNGSEQGLPSSRSLERKNHQSSLLRRVLSPRTTKTRLNNNYPRQQQIHVAPSHSQQNHIHVIPESVVERKSIDKLNSYSQQQQLNHFQLTRQEYQQQHQHHQQYPAGDSQQQPYRL